MQLKTSNIEFKKYGSVYEQPIELGHTDLISQNWQATNKPNVGQFYHFNCEVCIEIQSGMAALVVGMEPDADTMEAFAVHRMVRINPDIFFTLIAITPNVTYKVITTPSYSFAVKNITPPYTFTRILPRIRINEILGYYYSIRNSGYRFKGETHSFFELTYVDWGSLLTEVDGKTYELKEKELIIYGPRQFHTQHIPEGSSCSYVTIIFDMNPAQNAEDTYYEPLINQVFHHDKKIYTLIKSFIMESSSQVPYADSLMLCLLQETILRLFQNQFIEQKDEHPVTGARQYYQDEILNKILAYIHDTIHEPITIAEICQKFSLSRSSLQALFKENLNQPPKKYINDLKLEKSRQLICENRYTISEIALKLGFSSIHYFSRAFTQKYHIAPSEYSKTLYKMQ